MGVDIRIIRFLGGSMRTNKIVLSIMLCFALCVLTPNCKQETQRVGTIEEIDGVTIVKNPNEPKHIEDIISLEVDLAIGVDEGDENYMFSAPVDIDSDSQGNIYVLDFRELTIKKYNSDGKFERNISSKGEGPGEIQRPYGICIDSQDLICILDLMERKIEVFNVNGDFQKAIKLNVRAEIIAVNNADELILKYDENVMEDEKTRRRVSKIGKYNSQENSIIDFFKKPKPSFKAIQRGREYRVETPYERFDIDSKGNIYIGTTNEYNISVYSPEGKLIRKFTRDFEPIPRDAEIMKKVMDQLSKSTPPNQLKEYEMLLVNHKIFEYISIDEKDRIWISLFQPPSEANELSVTNFDVFSASGEYLYNISTDKNIQRQLIFKNGFVYTLAQNETGYFRALRLKLVND